MTYTTGLISRVVHYCTTSTPISANQYRALLHELGIALAAQAQEIERLMTRNRRDVQELVERAEAAEARVREIEADKLRSNAAPSPREPTAAPPPPVVAGNH